MELSNLLAAQILVLILVLGAILMRLYTKHFITHAIGWDDLTCVVASLLALIHNCLLVSVSYHRDIKLLEGLFLPLILYNITLMAVKFAILHLYLRLFTCNRNMQWMIYGGMAYNFFNNIVPATFLAIVTFPQTGHDWDDAYWALFAGTHAKQFYSTSIATSTLNLVSDVYILCLPLPILWKMHLPRRRRVGLMAIFGTGSLGCAASLASLVLRVDIRDPAPVPELNLLNFPIVIPYITNLIEITVGIICACMPVCVPLFRKLPSPNNISFNSMRFPLYSFLPFHRNHSSGRVSSRVKPFFRSYLPRRFASANPATMAANSRQQKVASKAPRLGYLDLGSVMETGSMLCIPLQIHETSRER